MQSIELDPTTLSCDDTDDSVGDESSVVRFVLPEDAEFKSPWFVELSFRASTRIRAVKEQLCDKLMLSNSERFQLQTLGGRFLSPGDRLLSLPDDLPRFLIGKQTSCVAAFVRICAYEWLVLYFERHFNNNETNVFFSPLPR